jgi:16S rRNA (uracil1498-N3)-methyltransferase
MRIPRFYVDTLLASGTTVELSAQAAHHALQVLRLKTGTPLKVFNGTGGEYDAVLAQGAKRSAALEVQAFHNVERESSLQIELGQSVSRGDRMDFAVQKSVELGVASISPLLSERGVARLDNKQRRKKQEHWRRIAVSACEQCGRNRIPTVRAPLGLGDWLDTVQAPLKLALDPEGEFTISQLPDSVSCVCIMIGAEGGFSAEELNAAKQAGFVGVRLGARVLRTETAAAAALAALQMRWGDFS